MALVSPEFRPYSDDSISDNRWSEVLKIVATQDSNRMAVEGGYSSCVRFVDNLVVLAIPHVDRGPDLVVRSVEAFCNEFYETFAGAPI